MIICLKTWARQSPGTEISFCLNERLPAWIEGPCALNVVLTITENPNYYHVQFRVTGTLLICCQRCLTRVDYAYQHDNELIVLGSEAALARYSLATDCVVAASGELDLRDMVTDELHLYSPEIPHAFEQCDMMHSDLV